jgi:hypothetical protein
LFADPDRFCRLSCGSGRDRLSALTGLFAGDRTIAQVTLLDAVFQRGDYVTRSLESALVIDDKFVEPLRTIEDDLRRLMQRFSRNVMEVDDETSRWSSRSSRLQLH